MNQRKHNPGIPSETYSDSHSNPHVPGRDEVTISGEIPAMNMDDLERLRFDLELHRHELEMQNEELHRSQRELEAALKKYTDLYNEAPVGYVSIDERMIIREANRTIARLIGCDRDRLIHRTILEFLPESERQRVRHLCWTALQKGVLETIDAKLLGEKVDFDARFEMTLHKDERDDRKDLLRLAVTDISDLKKTQRALQEAREGLTIEVRQRTEALRESNWTLQTIIDEIPVMLCFYDAEGKVRLINREFEKMFGWSLEEMREIDVMAEVYPDPVYRQVVWDYMMKALPEWRDFRVRRRSGEFFESAWSNVRLPDGQFIGIGIDLSERRRWQAAIKDIVRKTFEILERERGAIAKELHDSLGGSLAAIKFSLEGRVEEMGEKPENGEMSLETIIDYIADLIKETKSISNRLRPQSLDELGLVSTIRAYLREFERFYPDIRIIRGLEINEADIPEEMKIVLYRVLQEALNNARKHSRASSIHIRLNKSDHTIQLEVEDDGCGFDAESVMANESHFTGYGLRSMKERVEILSGSFDIRSAPGKGTCVRMSLPLSGE